MPVEKAGQSKIGYVHLRAMGRHDMSQWQREFYPIFDRDGLIVDVRHNNGGNIDSWILEKLLRKAWFYWQPRVGNPTWNMQYAFRGHVVVICDEDTASDGEAFAEGFRRLGLGKVIGTRTWGGEIWLSSSNFLVDRGIATAAETGVFGPDGDWLIEGHGVDPDLVVDNLPHATYAGGDAQLDAAIKYLQERDSRRIRFQRRWRRSIRTSHSSREEPAAPSQGEPNAISSRKDRSCLRQLSRFERADHRGMDEQWYAFDTFAKSVGCDDAPGAMFPVSIPRSGNHDSVRDSVVVLPHDRLAGRAHRGIGRERLISLISRDGDGRHIRRASR